MLWLPPMGLTVSGPFLYEQEIERRQDKIVWYYLQRLPQIAPADESGKQALARNSNDGPR
jgi:hypothetical protein